MTDERSEFLRAFQLGLSGDVAAALEALERSALRRDSAALTGRLLEAYIDAGRMDAADVVAAEGLRRWPNYSPLLAGIAELRERQGRIDEALHLVESAQLDRSPHLPIYPLYLRLLVEAGRYGDAAREAQRGLGSLWHQLALLTLALAHIVEGNFTDAARALAGIDMQKARPMLVAWFETVSRAGAFAEVERLLATAQDRLAHSEPLIELVALLPKSGAQRQ